jgi:hypothetical protein
MLVAFNVVRLIHINVLALDAAPPIASQEFGLPVCFVAV